VDRDDRVVDVQLAGEQDVDLEVRDEGAELL